MKPYKVKILGDEFSLFSKSRCNLEISDCLSQSDAVIEPDLKCDFRVSRCENRAHLKMDSYSAAASAAAFLFFGCGLPLEEISLSLDQENISVFNTGAGLLSIKPPKCQVKFANFAFCHSAPIAMTMLSGIVNVQVVAAKSVEDFDSSLAPILAMRSGENPLNALLICKNDGDDCVLKSCTSYLEYPPSRLALLLVFVAYLEKCAKVPKRIVIDGYEASVLNLAGSSFLSFAAVSEKTSPISKR